MFTKRSIRAGGCAVSAGLLLFAAGCGDDDDGAISKEDFVAQANAICQEASDVLDEEFNTAPGPKEFFYSNVIPSIRGQIDDMRDLGFPDADEELLDSLFNDTEAVLDELAATPDDFGTGPNPFAELNQRMTDYGLTVCAAE